jgi:hypothetical protein
MKRYAYRTQPIVVREGEEPSWINEYVNNLEKSSVESRKTVEQRSLYDQISSIMGSNKPKYSTVEAAVDDMQERSGIKAYWNRIKDNVNQIKQAQEASQAHIFVVCPQLKDTINNCVEDSRGNLSIPSIISRLKTIHKSDVGDTADWDDPAFLKYINDKNIEVKRRFPDAEINSSSLGKIHHFDDEDLDPSNKDMWRSLMPSKVD